MKLVLYLLLLGFCSAPLFAQIYTQEKIIIQDEALLFVQGGGLHFATGSVLENRGMVKLAGNWQNNAAENLILGRGKIIFSDKNPQFILGGFPTSYHFLEINSHSVLAQQNLRINSHLQFSKGNLHFQKTGFLGRANA